MAVYVDLVEEIVKITSFRDTKTRKFINHWAWWVDEIKKESIGVERFEGKKFDLDKYATIELKIEQPKLILVMTVTKDSRSRRRTGNSYLKLYDFLVLYPDGRLEKKIKDNDERGGWYLRVEAEVEKLLESFKDARWLEKEDGLKPVTIKLKIGDVVMIGKEMYIMADILSSDANQDIVVTFRHSGASDR